MSIISDLDAANVGQKSWISNYLFDIYNLDNDGALRYQFEMSFLVYPLAGFEDARIEQVARATPSQRLNARGVDNTRSSGRCWYDFAVRSPFETAVLDVVGRGSQLIARAGQKKSVDFDAEFRRDLVK